MNQNDPVTALVYRTRKLLGLADGSTIDRALIERAVANDAPAVSGVHPGQQPQKRGFARAVGATDAQAHAGVHLQRKIAEDVPSAKRF